MRKLEMQELDRPDLETYKRLPKIPLVVVLDNIRSQQNVGAIFRTCDAYLAEKIVLCGITATPPHREIHRSALGATESVEWEYRAEVTEVVQELKEAGYLIAGIEQTEGSMALEEFIPDRGERIVLIFGNEVNGISDALLPQCDIFLELKQFGTKHSLNVSVCAGIVIWDLFYKLK